MALDAHHSRSGSNMRALAVCLQPSYSRRDSAHSAGGASGGEEEISPMHKLHLGPEKGFFHLLKNAMLAIHLLPTNCNSGTCSGSVGCALLSLAERWCPGLVGCKVGFCTCALPLVCYKYL